MAINPSSVLGNINLGEINLAEVDASSGPVVTPAAEILAALQFFPNPPRLKTPSENLGYYTLVEFHIPPDFGDEAAFISSITYNAPKKVTIGNLGFSLLTEFAIPIPPSAIGAINTSEWDYQPGPKRLKENLGSSTLVEFSVPYVVPFTAVDISSFEYDAPKRNLKQPNGGFFWVRDTPRTVVNLLQPITQYPDRTWRAKQPNLGVTYFNPLVIPNTLRQCEITVSFVQLNPSSAIDPTLVGARITRVVTFRGDPVC